MRRTYVQLMADELKGCTNHRASKAVLAARLGWPQEKFDKTLDRAIRDEGSCIDFGPGGVIKFAGTERNTGGGVGLYADVQRVINDHWAPKVLGAREGEMFSTSQSGRRGGGEWTHPDLVLACFPRRRPTRDSLKDLHAFEVETRGGFTIKSMYQAYEQAQGADYAWVFAFAGVIDKADMAGRVERVAKDTGVGVVEFDRPGASATYRKRFQAVRLDSDLTQRLGFVTRVLGRAGAPELMGGRSAPERG
jgi:hypothetical protein